MRERGGKVGGMGRVSGRDSEKGGDEEREREGQKGRGEREREKEREGWVEVAREMCR